MTKRETTAVFIAFRNQDATVYTSTMYLQRGGEEVVLRHDVDKEVGRDFPQLVVQHGDEPQVEVLAFPHGLLRATQQSQETLPVLEAVVNVPEQKTHEGKLELTCEQEVREG